MTEYTKEQFWKLYEKLPAELKEAVFSDEVGDHILDACAKNGVADKVSAVAKYTGRVLLGVLLPQDFQQTLEKEVGIESSACRGIATEINRFVFFPVKESLNQIHTIVPEKSSTPISSTPIISQEETRSAQQEPPKKARPKKADVYKEQIDDEE